MTKTTKWRIREFLRELPYIIGTMACFALIGVLLALGV